MYIVWGDTLDVSIFVLYCLCGDKLDAFILNINSKIILIIYPNNDPNTLMRGTGDIEYIIDSSFDLVVVPYIESNLISSFDHSTKYNIYSDIFPRATLSSYLNFTPNLELNIVPGSESNNIPVFYDKSY